MSLIMIHAGGWNEAGDDLGFITKRRIQQAVGIWHPEDRILITAGSRDQFGEPICEPMGRLLIEHGIPESRILIPEGVKADNTIAETIEAVRVIKERGLGHSLYVVSDWWHTYPRLWFIWRHYGGKVKPIFKPVNQKWNGLKCHFIEIKGAVAVLKEKTGPRYVKT